MIKLPVKIPFNSKVSPIQLPKASDRFKNYVNSESVVSGFGRTSERSQISKTLNFVNMRVVDNKDCLKLFGAKIVNENVICAKGWIAKNQNACMGGEETK